MKNCKKLDLNSETIKGLRNHFEEKMFQVDQELVYRGHIPSIGLLLLEGLVVAKNTRSTHKYDEGSLIGISELLKGEPSKYTIKIKSGSKVILFDRTGLLELTSSKKTSDQKLISEIA